MEIGEIIGRGSSGVVLQVEIFFKINKTKIIQSNFSIIHMMGDKS